MTRGRGGDRPGPRHGCCSARAVGAGGRALVVLVALPLLTGCTGSAADREAAPVASRSPVAAVLDQAVVVDLAVAWRAEHTQTQEQVRQQRGRVAQAQEEVLVALGPHGRLRRELHETAQTALLVDTLGRRILQDHPRVVAVHEDVPAPADTAG